MITALAVAAAICGCKPPAMRTVHFRVVGASGVVVKVLWRGHRVVAAERGARLRLRLQPNVYLVYGRRAGRLCGARTIHVRFSDERKRVTLRCARATALRARAPRL